MIDMPVLDTTFLIDLHRDPDRFRGELASLAEQGEPLLVPAQAAIEYSAGIEEPARALRQLKESFTFIAPDEAISLEAARLAREAFRQGIFPGWPDLQIGATASYLGMAVVTRNPKHFEPLGVEVLSYG